MVAQKLKWLGFYQMNQMKYDGLSFDWRDFKNLNRKFYVTPLEHSEHLEVKSR